MVPNPRALILKPQIESVNSSMGWVKTPHHEFAMWVGELRCLRLGSRVLGVCGVQGSGCSGFWVLGFRVEGSKMQAVRV